MKRISLALVVLFFLVFQLMAQGTATPSRPVRTPSEYYPFRLEVVRVYTNAMGYRVVYRQGASGFAEAYLPIEWFTPGGKAALIASDDPSFPSMTIFYKAGAFSHVRLYVKSSRKDPSWGSIETSPELTEKFKVTELKP